MNQVTVTAPAKIILLGEHAVVYPPYKGIASSINITWAATATESNSKNYINLTNTISPQFSFESSISDIDRLYEQFKEMYSESCIEGRYSEFKEFLHANQGELKLAVGLAKEYIEDNGGVMPSCEVTVSCNIPYVKGFGGSASIGSTIMYSIIQLSGVEVSMDQMFELTHHFENYHHSNSSGLDPATVVYGGLVEYYRDNEENKYINQIEIKNSKIQDILNNFFIVHTGTSTESTGDLVHFVAKKISKDSTQEILSQINNNTKEFLELVSSDTSEDLENRTIRLINTNGKLLENLGVVSESGIEFCEFVRGNGGAAKMSGGGGIEGACGAILVYHKDKKIVIERAISRGYKVYETGFGVEGLKLVE